MHRVVFVTVNPLTSLHTQRGWHTSNIFFHSPYSPWWPNVNMRLKKNVPPSYLPRVWLQFKLLKCVRYDFHECNYEETRMCVSHSRRVRFEFRPGRYCSSGSDSSAGIATGFGLDGPGIESRWGRGFTHLSRPALGTTQPPVQWVPGLSRG